MNNFAERWDCKRLRCPVIDDVTKNVRNAAAMAMGSDRRSGTAMAACSRMQAVGGCDG